MKRNRFLAGLFLLCLTAGFVFVPLRSFLVIEPVNGEGEAVLFRLPDNHSFSVRYTHSIHLSEVEEYYRQTVGNDIQQTALLYEDTAIGMPSDAAGNEKFEVTEEGKYLISNMTNEFPYIDIRIGQVVANHRLVVDRHAYPLADYFDKGSVVRLQVKNQSLYEQWKGVTVVGER
ncbi:DUF1850 domain-containing protein [Bacillus sp. KH172YL63]|uniref:DUF1850 domain-containing protein n=1 Tax=Bacillus sp. KH172YL63 TaxID=2709784 RepID=UPI0013E4731F|nr:DUF1850 domain-containing protein [Bacillus sp. KH172YL63]BCB03080.1 hypothetical protein KH172YL63_12130 [Bacillus sp. KH172YL63]